MVNLVCVKSTHLVSVIISWQDDLTFECVHTIFELRQAEQKFHKLSEIYAKRWKTENWEIQKAVL